MPQPQTAGLPVGDSRFRAIFESAAMGIAMVDSEGRIVESNPALQRMLGFSSDELLVRKLNDIIHPDDVHLPCPIFLEMLDGQREPLRLETRKIRSDGGIIWGRLTASRVGGGSDDSDDAGPSSYALLMVEEITNWKLEQELLQRLASVDELTGVYNRRGFLLLAEQQWKLAARKDRPLQLLYVDIDRFKEINDSYGHAEGDRALVSVARLLRGCYRETDLVARMGGDEFVVLAVEAEETSTELLVRRIESAVAEHNLSSNAPYELSLSIGAARYPADQSRSLQDLLDWADRLMYEQKRLRRAGGLD